MSEVPPHEREPESHEAADSPSSADLRRRRTDGIQGASAPPADVASEFGAPVLVTTGVPHFPPPGPASPFEPAPPARPGTHAGGAIAAPPAERRSAARRAGRFVRELAETVVLALLIFLLVRAVVQNFQVEGRSMQPTLQTHWYLLVNKALYWEVNLDTVSKFVPFVDPGDDPTRYLFRGPRRGDIIVFKAPTQTRGQPERDFIKRIIGLPGDVVEVHDGTVFVNALPLKEPYISEPPQYTCGPLKVPEGHYYVLGDNRNQSSDSHNWGFLSKEGIIGQAWLIYWPFSEFGWAKNTTIETDTSVLQDPPKNDVPIGALDQGCPALP